MKRGGRRKGKEGDRNDGGRREREEREGGREGGREMGKRRRRGGKTRRSYLIHVELQEVLPRILRGIYDILNRVPNKDLTILLFGNIGERLIHDRKCEKYDFVVGRRGALWKTVNILNLPIQT